MVVESKRPWRWPFVVGDRVVSRGNFGPLVCDVRITSERDTTTEYDIVATTGDGRWLALRDDDGRVYGQRWPDEGAPAYGHLLLQDCRRVRRTRSNAARR